MSNVLEWRILPRNTELKSSRPAFPASLVTLQPTIDPQELPVIVSLLLPNNPGTRSMIEWITGADSLYVNSVVADTVVGLFLANPFLNFQIDGPGMHRTGLRWVANLPTVDQHDDDFVRELSEVRLDPELEFQHLRQLQAQGFSTMAVVCTETVASLAAEFNPTAVLVVPKTENFIGGFPSMESRHQKVKDISSILSQANWTGPLLYLGLEAESADQQLWPDAVDAMVICPEDRA